MLLTLTYIYILIKENIHEFFIVEEQCADKVIFFF